MSDVKILNLVSFIQGLEADGAATEQLVSQYVRRFTLGFLRRVVLASPVDTGRFRGNWQVDIGSMEGPKGETGREDRSGGQTIASGLAEIAGHRAFEPVVIVNNVPYAARLNDGWSRQAPAGFVEAAIDAELNLVLTP
jgi:hypothetical protein